MYDKLNHVTGILNNPNEYEEVKEKKQLPATLVHQIKRTIFLFFPYKLPPSGIKDSRRVLFMKKRSEAHLSRSSVHPRVYNFRTWNYPPLIITRALVFTSPLVVKKKRVP